MMNDRHSAHDGSLERDIILYRILRALHGLRSLPPWLHCLLFSELDHMHLMRHHLSHVLLFAVLAIPRSGL